jgi:pimeloyl-ACP methyl ester carboxylesterase
MLLALAVAALFGGCAKPMTCPRVLYLDGAGWHSGHVTVRKGFRKAGFPGDVERFHWEGVLGVLYDHMSAGSGHPQVDELAGRITDLRRANPDGQIILVGLSAGTSIIVNALATLPEGVMVDSVALLSPSVSSRHDLTGALRHVSGRLYYTLSPHDGLLASATSAGLESGTPAGVAGFDLPAVATEEQVRLYGKVVCLPWRPGYSAYGWSGGHVSVTHSEFIRVVIAPRVTREGPHPLDSPVVLELASHE